MSQSILSRAEQIVNHRSEEADRKYGPFTEGMQKVADMASIMGNKALTVIDAFNVLIALKFSRQSYNYKEDNLLDAVAYIGGLDNVYKERANTIEPKILSNPKYQMYKDLYEKGEIIEVRGQKTKELLNYTLTLTDPYDRYFNFKGRKFSVKYLKRELLWYLNAKPNDYSITQYATIWKQIYEKDKHIYSNYGARIFDNNNFLIAYNTLKDDKYSRRAVIMIADMKPFQKMAADCYCTLNMIFNIRKDKLNLTVNMRSNDAIYGIANDIPFFTLIQEMMLLLLQEVYPELTMGTYTHQVASLHIYEKHFSMLEDILSNATELQVDIPRLTIDDVKSILQNEPSDFTNFLQL